MSMIFRFRMLSDENDSFLREYEVPYDMTLLDLNDFICDDLKYDAGNMASFFTSDDQWRKLREFTLADMGGGEDDGPQPLAMADVMLGQLIRRNHDRLIWQFDVFSDRSYYIELASAAEADPGSGYPKTVVSEGEPAPQFGPAGDSGGRSIFDDAMEEFGDFQGDEEYDDEY